MRQALELALDWIKKQPEETPESKYDVDTRYVVIREIEAALAQPEQEPVKLRRGDILRCIETDELCTVWFTSTTGKTRVKWSANNFGDYTKEQIGELFWLETEPDDLELAAEKSDNYAAFHAGYRFAVAHHLAQPEQEPVAHMYPCDLEEFKSKEMCAYAYSIEYVSASKGETIPLYTTPPQRKPLTDEQIDQIADEFIVDYRIPAGSHYDFAQAIEAAHGIKE